MGYCSCCEGFHGRSYKPSDRFVKLLPHEQPIPLTTYSRLQPWKNINGESECLTKGQVSGLQAFLPESGFATAEDAAPGIYSVLSDGRITQPLRPAALARYFLSGS